LGVLKIWLREFAGLLLVWLALAHGSVVAAQETNAPTTLVELTDRLTAIVSHPKYEAAMWGAKVISLDTGKTLFEHNARKLFSPASNSKLFTVALALNRFGPDYRIKTSLLARARPKPDGTLPGDLIVFGRGDPTFHGRHHQGNLSAAFRPLVTALTNAGVRRIEGDLVGDTSYFRGPEFGSGWAWDDLNYSYGAELSALTIRDNTLPLTVQPGEEIGLPCRISCSLTSGVLAISNRTVTVQTNGPRNISFYRPLGGNTVFVSGQLPHQGTALTEEIPISNPAALFIRLFKDALARHGIEVTGQVKTVNWLDRQPEPLGAGDLCELGQVESLPLREIASLIQKPSQNLYTDLLLAHVGESLRKTNSTPEMTSEELGIRALNEFMRQTGAPPGEIIFEEGSGLSRNNLVSPNAAVALLQHMSRSSCASAFFDALPVAGVDGTLRNRMKGSPAAGNVRAKTGTLRWANSLSGTVTSAAGERLAFSLMLNRYYAAGRSTSSSKDLDTIASLLASFTGRSEN
jgi:D-alanyl-D-alanine carboxypeptidase/D-alanyl-D-alanine-endopeptidase (penicillin-binding protein 4)